MIEFLIIAVIFYFLGKYSGREAEVIEKATKAVKKQFNKPPVGVIRFPTPQESSYRGSEREKIDQEQIRVAKEAGILK